MVLSRRSFLSLLSFSAAAIAVDPEMLGWTKTKSIFIPPAPKLAFCKDAFTMAAIDLPLPPPSYFYLAADGLWQFDGKETRLITPEMFSDGAEWPLRYDPNFPLDNLTD